MMNRDPILRADVRRRKAKRKAVTDRIANRQVGVIRQWMRIWQEENRKGRFTLPTWHAPLPAFGSLRLTLGRVLLAGGAVAVPVVAVAWTQSATVLSDLARAMECAQTTAFLASDGTVLAAVPVDSSTECQEARAMLTAPHSAETTARLSQAVVAIEGSFASTDDWVWLGHDVRGFARKGLEWIGVLEDRGFSAPLLTTVEATLGEHDIGLWRKGVMMLATSRLAIDMSDDERAAFIVNHMPATIGGGDPRAGALAADALFGRPPETTLEFCQLARAMGQQMWLVGDVVTDAAATSWETVNGPATESCIRQIATSPADEAAAMAGLRAACGGTDICFNPPPAPVGVPESMAERGRLASLVGIAQSQMPRFTPLVPDEGLRLAAVDLMRLNQIDPGGALGTTIDAALQARLDRAIDVELDAIDRTLPEGICLTGQCIHRVDHTILVGQIAEEGVVDLRAVHLNRTGGIAGWPERDDSGQWHAQPPRFGLASTGKAALALVAVEHGLTRLCSNPDGGAACEGGTWVPLERALGHSLSGPHEWLANQYPADVAALEDGLSLNNDTTVVDPAFDAAYGIGRATMTPANALALMGAIVGDGTSGLRLFPGQSYANVELGATPDALTATSELLRAPFGPGGTLAEAGAALRALGVTLLGGKSGTHTENGIDLVLAETIAVEIDGRRYVIVIALTATDVNTGLADLRHADLTNLLTAILRQIME